MFLPLSPRNPGVAANTSILAGNFLEGALCTMTGKTMTSYSLPAGSIRAGNLHARTFLEVGGSSFQVFTSLPAVAALILAPGALCGVLSQFI
jgi:hypothetical protein